MKEKDDIFFAFMPEDHCRKNEKPAKKRREEEKKKEGRKKEKETGK